MLTPIETNLSQLQMLFREHLPFFFLSETKMDESFPNKQFCLNNFRIFQKDRNWYGAGIGIMFYVRYGGGIGIMFYVNKNLFCKSLTTKIGTLTETIFLEVNVQRSKWLFVGCCKPPSQNE